MLFSGPAAEFLGVYAIQEDNACDVQLARPTELRIFWNKQPGAQITIDGIVNVLEVDELIFLTEYHHIESMNNLEGRLIKFNRPFYCLDYHDEEVGCRGMLFFGASNLPTVQLEAADFEIFDLLWRVLQLEIGMKDTLQLEMLRTLLKRWIMLCLRVFRRQSQLLESDNDKIRVVREFNYLVEQHYRRFHDVQSYANFLHKSPKTLANLFAKYGSMTPSQVIQGRIVLEAKRLLVHSGKSVKEIAYLLGFEDLQTFSRFFNKKEGLSPTAFKASHKM